ncbi:MAG: hypothetical protein K2L88_00665 [Clostridiales bacterium]|nr:hypothetical protein [Clostridiales bacterium]
MKNAKRLITTILLLCAVMLIAVGCTPTNAPIETEFDDMEISKIETAHWEGFAPFPGYYLRTFDFKHGTVSDTLVLDAYASDYINNIPREEADKFNNPKQITTFTEEQAKTLYEKIKSLGFLAWGDEYITDETICDGGSESVTVYFSDGTVKSTKIYFIDPPKYEEIRKAFEDNFGVTFYLSF